MVCWFTYTRLTPRHCTPILPPVPTTRYKSTITRSSDYYPTELCIHSSQQVLSQPLQKGDTAALNKQDQSVKHGAMTAGQQSTATPEPATRNVEYLKYLIMTHCQAEVSRGAAKRVCISTESMHECQHKTDVGPQGSSKLPYATCLVCQTGGQHLLP